MQSLYALCKYMKQKNGREEKPSKKKRSKKNTQFILLVIPCQYLSILFFHTVPR